MAEKQLINVVYKQDQAYKEVVAIFLNPENADKFLENLTEEEKEGNDYYVTDSVILDSDQYTIVKKEVSNV